MTYTPLAPFGSTKRKATQDMKCKTCHLACWTSEFGCAGCAFVSVCLLQLAAILHLPVNVVVLLLLLQIATTLPCVISTDTNTFILVLLRL